MNGRNGKAFAMRCMRTPLPPLKRIRMRKRTPRHALGDKDSAMPFDEMSRAARWAMSTVESDLATDLPQPDSPLPSKPCDEAMRQDPAVRAAENDAGEDSDDAASECYIGSSEDPRVCNFETGGESVHA
jgi:hypothetical protein